MNNSGMTLGQFAESLECKGDPPQARFGHTITLVSKNKAILFGGATGDTGRYSMTGDTYSLNILKKEWTKLTVHGIAPSPRAAHSSTSVELMQMVVYGGATGGGSLASDDLFLLDMRQGEDLAQWMIVPVVGATPGRRYGHSIIFTKPYILVFGGNTGSEAVSDVWCLSVEKAPFSWQRLDCGKENPPVRVYHNASLCQTGSATGMMVIFGGRTADQSPLNDTYGLRRHRDGKWDWVKAPYKQGSYIPTCRYQHTVMFLGSVMVVVGGRTNQVAESVPLEAYDTETSEWYKFPSLQRFRHSCFAVDYNLYVHGGFEHETPNIPTAGIVKIDTTKMFKKHENLLSKDLGKKEEKRPAGGGKVTQKLGSYKEEYEPKLFNQAFIAVNYPVEDQSDFSKIVRKISIDKLQEESKKLGSKIQLPITGGVKNNREAFSNMFLAHLLKPKEWSQGIPDKFIFKKEHVVELVKECQGIVEEQPILLKLRAPLKVIGDLHGQFQDLMRFFDLWRGPMDGGQGGDIESFDYLFLGDYVDRGNRQLETICLLMALKVKYPKQIHLLRGNHEDRVININFGLGDECQRRLNEDITDPNSVFSKLNIMFEYLPLGAIVEDRILCVHGGIGSTVMRLEDIIKLNRPLEVVHEISNIEQQMLIDLLWSDPTASDDELGIKQNFARDPNGTSNIVRFGPDRVEQFLKLNNLGLIIRSHECVMDGFERFAKGELLTLFSATNYCSKYNNGAAILVIQKTFEIIPKVIYPLENAPNTWQTEDQLAKRPPTPPRWRLPTAKRDILN